MDAALDSATSALYAQSKALSVISNNLANSSTTGYKAVSTSFASLVSGESSTTSSVTGGVLASAQQNINTTGNIESTGVSTNMAIDGKGMFVVGASASGTNSYYYTRDGDFTTDSDGYLTENGYYLMGWPTDQSGAVTASDTTTTSGLEAINVDRYNSTAAATQNVTVGANLPADATSGASFTSTMAIYDSLGAEEDVPVVWTKLTTSNEWTMSFGSPTSAATGSVSGTLGGVTTYTVDFSANGTLSSIEDSSGNAVSAATLTVSSWSDGADTTSDGSVNVNLGTSGKADGLTQYATSTTATVSPTFTQDGLAYGTLDSVAVNSDGTVVATYTNGKSLDIYKVAVATFNNEDGLAAQSGDVFQQTAASGSYTLNIAGSNGAGNIKGGSLESSNVDTSSEFTLMIQAQQAYSAASKVISTDTAMFNSLISAMG